MSLRALVPSFLALGVVACGASVEPSEAGDASAAIDVPTADAAPDAAPPRTGVVRIGVGVNGGCAVDTDAGLWCWGLPVVGLDGGPSPNLATRIDEAHDVADVSPFLEQVLVLQRDGTVSGWGHSSHGQLGEAVSIAGTTPTVQALPGLRDVIEVSSGHEFACALTNEHRVECWGGGPGSSLGVQGLRNMQAPVVVPNLDDVVDVSASAFGVCAVRASGEVWCWGDGAGFGAPTPTRIEGITDAVRVAAGWMHGCALRAGGSVVCWGENSVGELGDGTTTFHGSPVAVLGLSDATDVTAGDQLSCALRASGSVVCWGISSGFGVATPGTAYREISGVGPSTQVVAGGWQACALERDGAVRCWGRPGAYGTETTSDTPATPIGGLPQ